MLKLPKSRCFWLENPDFSRALGRCKLKMAKLSSIHPYRRWATNNGTTPRPNSKPLRGLVTNNMGLRIIWVSALSVGFTSGLGLLVAQISFGSFIFSGPLAPYSSQGVGLVLFGNFAACLIIALLGDYRGAISGLSPALVIVMATIGFTMDAQGDVLFVTTVVALMISAVTAGVCYLAIGYFRLSDLVRFIPYPVSCGFVAGIGGTVCLAAMSLMGADPHLGTIPALVDPSVLWKWAPGAAYGVALYLAMKHWNNPLILPLSAVLAIGTYYIVLATLDISGNEARAAGLLLTGTSDAGLWPAVLPADLMHVDWAVMAMQIPAILTVILFAFITVILNIAGLEMAANQELDWNRAFMATGFANVISGLGGGTTASMIVPASLRSKQFGATTRLTGVVAALVVGGALFLGDKILDLIPVPLIGGILFFAGAGMLDQGLLKTRKRLPWTEYCIIILIFFVMIIFGLFEGVGTGMVATLVFLAARLSRTGVIESEFTIRERPSRKVRPVPDRVILMERGDRVHVYRLHGYIFFGSIWPLINRLRRHLSDSSHSDGLMLDFSAVSGSDFSTVNVLCRFLQSAKASGIQVVLCNLQGPLQNGLERTLSPEEFASLRTEPDTERALEHCEEVVIAAWRKEASMADEHRASLLARVSDDLERHLEQQIHFEELMNELKNWLNPRHYSAEEVILEPGSPHTGLQLFISGRASAYDSAGIRIHQYGPGDAVWSAGLLDNRIISVIADESCRTMELTPGARNRLEQHEAWLALKLYRYLFAEHYRNEHGDDQ